MAFDPNLPQENTLIDAAQMRAQLNGIVEMLNALLPSVTAEVANVTTLPAGDPVEVTVNFNGSVLSFTFAIPQGQDGPAGPQGEQGPPGPQGADGPAFATVTVDGVTTLPPGDNATVTAALSGNTVHLEFGIPQGAPGEVTTSQMDTAIADAVATTSSNSNAVTTLDTPFPDPADEEIRQKLNELIQALRR